MQNANHHDGFLKWLIENQIIAEFRDDEPADLPVALRSFADAPPDFRMLREKISGIEDEMADAFRRFGIIGGNMVEMSSKSRAVLDRTRPGS